MSSNPYEPIAATPVPKTGPVVAIDFDGVVTDPDELKSAAFAERGYDMDPTETSREYCLEVEDIPKDDYGWTKVVGEQMALSLTEHFDLPIATVRPFNPYGPRESFDPDDSHVIPAFIRRAAEGEDPFVVWGSGEQVRTFTYVRDLAEGMVTAMADVKGGSLINLSDTKSVSIGELAETVLDVTGHDAEVAFDESKPEGVKIRKPDMHKAEAEMDWEPSTPLRDGIRATYEWYVEQRG